MESIQQRGIRAKSFRDGKRSVAPNPQVGFRCHNCFENYNSLNSVQNHKIMYSTAYRKKTWFSSEANTRDNSAITLCRIQQLTACGTQIHSRKHSAVWQISEPLRTGTHHEKW